MSLDESSTVQPEVGNVVTGFSLADLAGMDTSDIAVIKSRLPLAGIYEVLCKAAGLKLVGNDPTKPLIQVQHKFDIMGFEPTVPNPDLDISKMIGKSMSDSTTLWADDIQREIGLLKGKYAKAGLDTSGPFGGMPEQGLVGWVDGAVDKMLKIRVRHFESKGEERASIDWVGAVEAAA